MNYNDPLARLCIFCRREMYEEIRLIGTVLV